MQGRPHEIVTDGKLAYLHNGRLACSCAPTRLTKPCDIGVAATTFSSFRSSDLSQVV